MKLLHLEQTEKYKLESARQVIHVLNGPPGCGKDTVADNLMLSSVTGRRYARRMFKEELYKLTNYCFNVDENVDTKLLYNDRVLKEVPTKVFTNANGEWLSPREALIETSEEIVKPRLGKGIFGRSLLSGVNNRSHVLVTDGGFIEEVEELAINGAFVHIIQLVGRGSFENDSRDYISKTEEGKFATSVVQLNPFTDNFKADVEGATELVLSVMNEAERLSTDQTSRNLMLG